MPDFIQGPTITSDIVAAQGNLVTTPAGGKDIHFDSGVLRAKYAEGAAGNGEMMPAIPEGAPAIAPVEQMDPELMKAVMSGKPPDPTMMARMATQVTAPSPRPANLPSAMPQIIPGAVDLRVPVGGGIVASVTFSGWPQAKHWKKLLRHVALEAEDEFDEGDAAYHEQATASEVGPHSRKRAKVAKEEE
jgi:hypothetical protein